ncbi:MAG TPA: hypothetical protein VF723_08675 [Pyrinomonadaceae bacterium]|jgi:putative hemolysin
MLKSSKSFRAAFAAAALLALAWTDGAKVAAQSKSGPQDASPAAQYCIQSGGVVQTRYPAYNTNGSSPLRLAGSAQFCQFTSSTDQSKINISLDTLYTQQPSLAALAYIFKPAYTPDKNKSSNPMSVYCSEIGGTDLFGGPTGNGAWVLENNPSDIVAMCVMPDLSMIDDAGLFYHTAGFIKGVDLTKYLRFKPTGELKGGRPTPFRK